MKLYATVSSERASKGQGGNKYVNIEVLYQEAGVNRVLSRLNVVIEEGEARLYADNHGVIASANIKGEQQKGETLEKCTHGKRVYGRCSECGYLD